jgi:hypothetical protein
VFPVLPGKTADDRSFMRELATAISKQASAPSDTVYVTRTGVKCRQGRHACSRGGDSDAETPAALKGSATRRRAVLHD